MSYIKIVSENKKCEVFLNENPTKEQIADLIEQGYEEGEWEKGWDGIPYVKGYAPVPPAPTIEEQKEKRAQAYLIEVDPITAHIQRERDEAEPDEEKITALIEERNQKVREIKEQYPYPNESEVFNV